MAPSATETITVPVTAEPKPATWALKGTGDYKELAPLAFDPDSEAGKKGFEAAKVSKPRDESLGLR
jgi:hypothetical protein